MQKIIWLFGFINVAAMIPQLVKLIKTQNVAGLSLEMFILFLSVQTAFALDGYFKRNNVLLVCLGLSAALSTTIIILILCFR